MEAPAKELARREMEAILIHSVNFHVFDFDHFSRGPHQSKYKNCHTFVVGTFVWTRGPMDKASAYGAGDCRFESCRGQFAWGLLLLGGA